MPLGGYRGAEAAIEWRAFQWVNYLQYL